MLKILLKTVNLIKNKIIRKNDDEVHPMLKLINKMIKLVDLKQQYKINKKNKQ